MWIATEEFQWGAHGRYLPGSPVPCSDEEATKLPVKKKVIIDKKNT